MRQMFQVLVVLGVLLTADSAQAQQPATATTSGWSFGLRGGIGTGRYLDLVDENCPRLTGDFNLSCEGDDRGLTWMAGFDLRRALGERFDVTFRAGVTRLPNIS